MKTIKNIFIVGISCITISCNDDIEKMGQKAAVEYCTCMLANDSYIDKKTYFHADSICLIPLNKKYGYKMSVINKHHGAIFADSVKNEQEKKESIIFEENFMNCYMICRERNISFHMPQDTFLMITHKDRVKCGCE